MNRRSFLASAALAPAAGLRPAAAKGAAIRRVPAADPELLEAVARFGRACDRIEALQAEYDAFTRADRAAGRADAFADAVYDPAADEMEAAETDLLDAMRARGVVAVLAEGRLTVDTCQNLTARCDAMAGTACMFDLGRGRFVDHGGAAR